MTSIINEMFFSPGCYPSKCLFNQLWSSIFNSITQWMLYLTSLRHESIVFAIYDTPVKSCIKHFARYKKESSSWYAILTKIMNKKKY